MEEVNHSIRLKFPIITSFSERNNLNFFFEIEAKIENKLATKLIH